MASKKMGRPLKWTEKEAMILANELIDWMLESPNNIWFESFIYIEKKLYPQLLSELANNYPDFAESLKRAKKIQEGKIIDGALQQKTNVAMSIFLLKNNHGYKDKNEQAIEHSGAMGMDVNINIKKNSKSDDEKTDEENPEVKS